MQAVLGLLLILLQSSHGAQTYCDGRQNGTQCYAALGGQVDIQLMDEAADTLKFNWIKNQSTIFVWRNRAKVEIINIISNRSDFSPKNGTIRIKNLGRIDSGIYKLELFDSIGSIKEQRLLQLFVEAPVSSVLLLSECSSQGQMEVSCRSEGGRSPQYSWTLDGHTLTHSELLSGHSQADIITLRPNISGRLNCSVKNHVSESFNMTTISACEFINCSSNGRHISGWVFKGNNTLCDTTPTAVPTTASTVGKTTETNPLSTNTTETPRTDLPWYINILMIMGSILAVIFIFLVVGVSVVCAQRRKPKQGVVAVKDDQELIYADVRIVRKQHRQVVERVEAEVEYGQVKFSNRPRRSEQSSEDVYAKVRKGR